MKFGIIFYSFIAVFLVLSVLFGILSIYLIIKYDFELYYFIPLFFDLIITSFFICIVYYLCNQILDVYSNLRIIRITLRNGRTYDISKKHEITYSDNAILIKIKHDINKSIVIYKNISYFNDSTSQLLSILESHNDDLR